MSVKHFTESFYINAEKMASIGKLLQLTYDVILLDILNEVNQHMGGYGHYSYLFPYPGLHRTNLDNLDETNQKSTDFHGYILTAIRILRTKPH